MRAWEAGSLSPVGRLARFNGALYWQSGLFPCLWKATGSTTTSWVKDRNGVAAGGDPSVDGLDAPVGTIAFSADGTLAWLHYATGMTAWRLLNETRVSVTAAGGPLSALDLGIAVPENKCCCIEIAFAAPAAGVAEWTLLRANGAALTCTTSAIVLSSGGAVVTPSVFAGRLVAGGVTRSRFVIGPVVNGVRWIRGEMASQASGAFSGCAAGIAALGAIASVGVLSASGSIIADGTVLSAYHAESVGWSI